MLKLTTAGTVVFNALRICRH